jgi:DNA-binding CsgD family transcriptional regulator
MVADQPHASLTSMDMDMIRSTGGGPGILIFTSFLRLQFINQEARRLLRRTTHMEGLTATGILPTEITSLLKQIRDRLQRCTVPKDWEEIEMTQALEYGSPPILARGFGLPDLQDIGLSRILLLLEERVQRIAPPSELKERFQLTGREQAVLEHLCKGLTNKEIAAGLGIALTTVKEHMRSIMKKTKTSTRTALMGEVFRMAS